MRIGVLTSLFPSPPRPYEGIFAERRWRGMAERGHDVRVVHPLPRTPGPLATGAWAEIRDMPRRERRGPLEVERPRYWHLPGRAAGNADRFARAGVPRLLAGAAPDAVVLDYAWPAARAAAELARRGVPTVVSGRGSDVLQVAGEAGLGDELARGLRAAGHWCAVSADLVETMDRLGEAPGRGVLVPNGVDVELFRPRDRAAARRELGLEATGTLVLVVGHLIPRKDPLLALEAVAALPPDARAVFLGRGPLEEELATAVRERGLDARVRLAGERPPEELATWYAASDVLLLTSRREGRPNVLLEALASGRPVVATEAGGTAELLGPFPEMLVRSRRAEDLTRALLGVLAGSPSPEELHASVEGLSWGASLDALERCLQDAIRTEGARA